MYSIDENNHLMSCATVEWSRQEDKIFEKALVEFPEGVGDRWRKIAEYLPAKSPEEVKAHYEALLYDIAEIDSGRVELPSYSDESGSIGWENERARSRAPGQISFGSPGNRSRHLEVERKKGTPWTEDEHRLFLIGLDRYGKGDWRSISRNVVVTRTPTQVASHAQKYFLRHTSGKKERKRSSIHDITTAMDSLTVPPPAPTSLPTQGGFQDFNFSMPSGDLDQKRDSSIGVVTRESRRY
ncbi:Duplicated homeodomain-like superfamily protein [Perilla frutescens var. hirtella]|uniref:Duplicated homeodomain-like superfamily protein n=1 Tax=Perilla frutescens var. hirtella TaxID=608512 RepID=A0AAD4J9M3_PERFH|nr:Duplicated homeodomain-like superfamily protein [Perilla frutescens var. hirtella]